MLGMARNIAIFGFKTDLVDIFYDPLVPKTSMSLNRMKLTQKTFSYNILLLCQMAELKSSPGARAFYAARFKRRTQCFLSRSPGK